MSKVKVKGLPSTMVYTGNEISFTEQQISQCSIRYKDRPLTRSDFDIVYANNKNVGTATVLFLGKGNYTGSVKKTFRVVPNITKSFDLSSEDGFEVAYEKDGTTLHNLLVSMNGIRLYEGRDYVVKYKKNKKCGTAEVIVTGRGNYKGLKTTRQFIIVAAKLSSCTIKVSDVPYLGKAGNYTSSPLIFDAANGKRLQMGKDYKKLTYRSYIYEKAGQFITFRKKNDLPMGAVVRVTLEGCGNYTGELAVQYHVVRQTMKKAKVKIRTHQYNGEAISPDAKDIIVKIGKKQLEYGKDYIVEGCYNNVNKGNATIVLKGIGEYSGYKSGVFRIQSMNFFEKLFESIAAFT